MENAALQCLCGKVFTVVKSLSAHESQCKVYKDGIDDLYSRHSRFTKNHRGDRRHKKKRKRSHRDSPPSNSLHSHSPQRSFSPNRHAPTPNLQATPAVDLDYSPPSFSPGQGVAHDDGNQAPMGLELNNEPDSEAGPSNICAVVNPSQPRVATRSGRAIRLPARYNDFLPGDSIAIPQVPGAGPPAGLPPTTPSISHSSSPRVRQLTTPCYQTDPNNFGLYRVYPTRPTLDPDQNSSIASHVDAPTLEQSLPHISSRVGSLHPAAEIGPDNLFSAFSNPTAGLLMCWQYSGSTTKSAAELQRLWSFMKDPAFDAAAHSTFSHERERKNIEKYLSDEASPIARSSTLSNLS
ncbi:hypothetical protein JVT61DRAFT_14374 [Boletus reticuloceps]|uniref:Uncharacterized protein n=1 Tax=Boletus reticuloceps TaxID=495285 RepID=A0A8I3A2J7_9AGAM|nr:hypothetical protein JVT61DRAFT_14374 [Boletus reticuloceps]